MEELIKKSEELNVYLEQLWLQHKELKNRIEYYEQQVEAANKTIVETEKQRENDTVLLNQTKRVLGELQETYNERETEYRQICEKIIEG